MTGPINLRRVHQLHKQFTNDNRRMVGEALRDAGEFAQNHVKSHSKFKRQSASGSLKDATEFKLKRSKNIATLGVISRKKYAHAIDLGARPHVILPRRKRLLRFMWRGRLVFARKVNHPGNRPYRFLYRATNAAYRIAGQDMRNRMVLLARRFNSAR
jgi:hypothetical protein